MTLFSDLRRNFGDTNHNFARFDSKESSVRVAAPVDLHYYPVEILTEDISGVTTFILSNKDAYHPDANYIGGELTGVWSDGANVLDSDHDTLGFVPIPSTGWNRGDAYFEFRVLELEPLMMVFKDGDGSLDVEFESAWVDNSIVTVRVSVIHRDSGVEQCVWSVLNATTGSWSVIRSVSTSEVYGVVLASNPGFVGAQEDLEDARSFLADETSPTGAVKLADKTLANEWGGMGVLSLRVVTNPKGYFREFLAFDGWIDDSASTNFSAVVNRKINMTSTTGEVVWKCLEYHPGLDVREVWFSHSRMEVPDEVEFYIGSADNPNGDNITWRKVNSYFEPVVVGDRAVYLKAVFDGVDELDFRSLGRNGSLNVEFVRSESKDL